MKNDLDHLFDHGLCDLSVFMSGVRSRGDMATCLDGNHERVAMYRAKGTRDGGPENPHDLSLDDVQARVAHFGNFGNDVVHQTLSLFRLGFGLFLWA